MYINIRIIGDWFSMDPILSAKLKTYRQNNCCIDMFGSIFSLTVNLDFSHFQEQVQILNSINPIYSLKLFFFDNFHPRSLKLKSLLFLKELKHLKCLQFNFPYYGKCNLEFWETFSD